MFETWRPLKDLLKDTTSEVLLFHELMEYEQKRISPEGGDYSVIVVYEYHSNDIMSFVFKEPNFPSLDLLTSLMKKNSAVHGVVGKVHGWIV